MRNLLPQNKVSNGAKPLEKAKSPWFFGLETETSSVASPPKESICLLHFYLFSISCFVATLEDP